MTTCLRILRRFLPPNDTDHRPPPALTANPAWKEPGTSKLKRGAAVRVDPLVRHATHNIVSGFFGKIMRPITVSPTNANGP